MKITHQIPDNTKIVCLGDSITAGAWDCEGYGWVGRFNHLLSNGCKNKYLVYNLGVARDTSEDALRRMKTEVTIRDPKIVIVKLGVNDVLVDEHSSGDILQIPESDRKRIWEDMSDFAEANKWRLVVIAPLPVADDIVRYDASASSNRKGESFRYENEMIKDYNKMLKAFCKVKNIPFVSLFDEWKNLGVDKLLQDGLHPNSQGHQMIAEAVYEKLEEVKYI